jgi:DNA repair photolyase
MQTKPISQNTVRLTPRPADSAIAVTPLVNLRGGPVDFWNHPAIISKNNFIEKSLSSWSLNIAVGCGHGCIVCSVPSTTTRKLGPKLREFGVDDPDAQWGKYALLRQWDEKAFLASLEKAEHTPIAELNQDGNRAVMLCTVTDAYQVFRASTPAKAKLLNDARRFMVRRALELIRDHSTLNVRILTRSPLAKTDFDIFHSFGKRLTFGMSLPTIDNRLARRYEPEAPAPSQKLATLKAARDAGLYVYVAVAPLYAECDAADIEKTFLAIRDINPITVFVEPVNVRADNVPRIEAHGAEIGEVLNTAVFANGGAWRKYALGQLMTVQQIARKLGMEEHLHLWPDSALGAKGPFFDLRREEFRKANPGGWESRSERQRRKEADRLAYDELHRWLSSWWDRVSEWPK